MALTVPWLAGADRHAPAWWRAKVWLPAGCFRLVGTFLPQSALMGDASHTVAARVTGTAVASTATFRRG
jgi:hypothetical protein